MKKTFIQADELLKDSFKLASQVFDSGYRPDYIVGVWRGGAPIGIAVQEFLDVLGIDADHIAAAAISTMLTQGKITEAKAKSALKTLDFDADAPNPARN